MQIQILYFLKRNRPLDIYWLRLQVFSSITYTDENIEALKHYYGITQQGELVVRGIEIRRHVWNLKVTPLTKLVIILI